MALGKGLGAILEEVGQAYEQNLLGESSRDDAISQQVEVLAVSDISPNPYQPRKHFDEQALLELSESIKKHGQLQPVVVVQKEDGYILIAGERRLRAHRLGKMKTIKAVVADLDIDPIQLREQALVENIQRENLNAMELANSYAELIEVHNITHEELTHIVHKSRSQITNTMRLLSLAPYVQEKILCNAISQGHAKVLVGLDADKQKVVADTIIGQKLSVRHAEAMVKQMKKKDDKAVLTKVKTDLFDASQLARLKEKLPFSHRAQHNKLEIRFESSDELDVFIDMIRSATT
jgi:ParB family transcriptional regulator, chromosome partitioning protein